MKFNIDWLVHDPTRLKAMIALAKSPHTFTELRHELEIPEDAKGRLDVHTSTLEDAGYVSRSREGRCPRNGHPYSMLRLTEDGYQALVGYCQAAESIIQSVHTAMSRTAVIR